MKDLDLTEAVTQLFYWQHSLNVPTNFHSRLYELFQKADSKNKMRLSVGFPCEAMALHAWDNAGDCGNDLFREYGLM